MQNIIPQIMPKHTVAIIGAGPAGLVTARWLAQHGFEPVIFEASNGLGGHWNEGGRFSAVWSGMRTNTSRIMTSFSDLEYPEGTATYPRRDEVHAYLERYADAFDLKRRIRLSTPVQLLDRSAGGWTVHSAPGGVERVEIFPHAVIASGRYIKAKLPEIPGLESFEGGLGYSHTQRYRGANAWRGKSVLVAGCSISALEIAADLALSGTSQVIASYRRQRYILPKLIAGMPTDHVLFTRASAMAGGMLPPAILEAGFRKKVLSVAGNPAQFGAPSPDANIFAAGISQSQHFLPSVAEGRIEVKCWIDSIDGRVVRFSDGSVAEPDGILFGTGYELSLPYLSPAVAKVLDIERGHIDLHEHTLHPELPGLAFVGVYDLIGPNFPVMELQARWLAYTLAGKIAPPTPEAMLRGLQRARARREGPTGLPMADIALLFARNAGVEPALKRWPLLQRALLAGPLSPVSFRLQGIDALDDAPEKTVAAAAAFGCITSPDFTEEESAMRSWVVHSDNAA